MAAASQSVDGALEYLKTLLEQITDIKTVTRDKFSFEEIPTNDWPAVIILPPDEPTAQQGPAQHRESTYTTTLEVIARKKTGAQFEALRKKIRDKLTTTQTAGDLDGNVSAFFYLGSEMQSWFLERQHMTVSVRFVMRGAH